MNWQRELSSLRVRGGCWNYLQVGRVASTATIHVDSSSDFRWPELAGYSVATLEELANGLAGVGGEI